MIQYPAIVNPSQTLVRTVSSTCVGEEYRLFISLPETYSDSTAAFPVLYLLDGNANFTLVKPIVEMQQFAHRVPEVIIVGVGYPTATYMDTVAQRGRDFTPVELTPEQKSTGYPWQETGGAPAFLSFVAHELIPLIDADFRTDPTDRTLAGFSLSATFVLYAMLQDPPLFKRMIALSPSFLSDILDIEGRYAQEHSSLALKLFMGMEKPTDSAETLEWIEHGQHLITTMNQRNYEGFNATLRVFEGIDHASIGTIGFTHALREIYQ